MNDSSFVKLFERARAGEASAIEQILADFGEEVRMMVRVRLPRVLRSQFDTLDFTQCIWASVLTGLSEPALRFESAGHFRRYLAGVARNKVLAEYRRRTMTAKYDLKREEPLYLERGGTRPARELVAPDPTPSELFQPEARLDQILSRRPPIERQVVELRQEGLTFEEIGRRLDIHDRTVRRILDRLWGLLRDGESA